MNAKQQFKTELKAKIDEGMESFPKETVDLCARRIGNELNEGNQYGYVKILPKPSGYVLKSVTIIRNKRNCFAFFRTKPHYQLLIYRAVPKYNQEPCQWNYLAPHCVVKDNGQLVKLSNCPSQV